MTSWEYCAVIGLFRKLNPALVYFQKDGLLKVPLALDEKNDGDKKYATTDDKIASLIAKLGLDGWELVNAGPGGDGPYHTLYFKRPISN